MKDAKQIAGDFCLARTPTAEVSEAKITARYNGTYTVGLRMFCILLGNKLPRLGVLVEIQGLTTNRVLLE